MLFPEAFPRSIIPDSTEKPESRLVIDLRAVDKTDDEELVWSWVLDNSSTTFSAIIAGTEEYVKLCNARKLIERLVLKELKVAGILPPDPQALAMFWAS